MTAGATAATVAAASAAIDAADADDRARAGEAASIGDAMLLVEGRSLPAIHRSAEVAVSPPMQDAVSPWQRAGDVGVTIGKATSRTSLRLAGVFSRAGVSLARSF
jgi:hypothetical protein